MKIQRTSRLPAMAGLFATAMLTACGTMASKPMAYSQAGLPASIQVPAGNKVAWETVGVGDITYECKATTGGRPGWVFIGPDAVLSDRQGRQVGKYYGPPAT